MRAASLRASRAPLRAAVRGAALGVALLAGLTACSQDARGVAAPTAASSPAGAPSSSPTPADEQEALLAQYRKFWASLTSVSRMPAAQRRVVLAALAVDPALKSVLYGMSQADLKRQVLYGANLPRPRVRINPDSTTALVDDCQDSSRAGVADRATGRRVTIGVTRNHVSATMKKKPGELWKIAFIDYAKSAC